MDKIVSGINRPQPSTLDLMPTEPTRRTMLALLGSLVPAAALAAYPDRPVKLVVALAPGGPADTAARVFAPYFAEQLGQNVVIENRTGASSVIGTESVVRSPPDGYTLLFGSSSSFAVNPAVMKNLRFDVQKDLKLVGLVSYTPHVLVVRASLAAGSLAELIALAKARPGKLTYASSGAGGAIHLASELFKREAVVDLVHVPYRGGGPAVMGLLTGDVDVFINDASTTVENVRAGKLKALAMAWTKRSPLLPEVPTFAELGLPAVISSSWFGLAAPVETPADVIGRLAAAMPQVFASPSYQARLEKLGLEQFALNPEQSAAFIKAEFDKWAAVAKSANIQVE
ncbi:MAG: tripartite tricarboxylate transporter substrate binding protein [Xanthobacteraceae bacterium]